MIRKVAWTNVWNRHSDGGTLIHLTNGGISGITVCGREYPADKGHPVSWRHCKICLKRASVDVTKLEWVPSAE